MPYHVYYVCNTGPSKTCPFQLGSRFCFVHIVLPLGPENFAESFAVQAYGSACIQDSVHLVGLFAGGQPVLPAVNPNLYKISPPSPSLGPKIEFHPLPPGTDLCVFFCNFGESPGEVVLVAFSPGTQRSNSNRRNQQHGNMAALTPRVMVKITARGLGVATGGAVGAAPPNYSAGSNGSQIGPT